MVAAILAALLVGALIGLLVRPFLDAYLIFKTAQLYERQDRADFEASTDVVR